MLLHKHYFGNLRKHGERQPGRGSPFREAAEQSAGSYEKWEADFTSVGKMRGAGWEVARGLREGGEEAGRGVGSLLPGSRVRLSHERMDRDARVGARLGFR